MRKLSFKRCKKKSSKKTSRKKSKKKILKKYKTIFKFRPEKYGMDTISNFRTEILKKNNDIKWKIFSLSYCGACNKTKELMNKYFRDKYEVFENDEQQYKKQLQKYKKKFGDYQYYPYIVCEINGQDNFFGGYPEIEETIDLIDHTKQ